MGASRKVLHAISSQGLPSILELFRDIRFAAASIQKIRQVSRDTSFVRFPLIPFWRKNLARISRLMVRQTIEQ